MAIAHEPIVAIAPAIEHAGVREIDVSGLVVSPGFFDIHSHSDATLLINPRAESAMRQGITPQIVGPDGFSPAPIRFEDLDLFCKDPLLLTAEGYEWTWYVPSVPWALRT